MANRDLKSVVYTSDDGRDYAMKMDAATFAQGGGTPYVGGADYDGSPQLPRYPANYRARYVTVSVAGNKRRVVCLTTTAPLWTGTQTTIDLQVLGAAAVTYTRYASTGERRPKQADPND